MRKKKKIKTVNSFKNYDIKNKNKKLVYMNRELKDNLNKINQEYRDIKNDILLERQKVEQLKIELENQTKINNELIDNEKKKINKEKRNKRYSYFRIICFTIIYCALVGTNSVGIPAWGYWSALIIALIYVLIDMLFHFDEKGYNGWNSYISLLKDLWQTILPTIIIGIFLLLVRTCYPDEFIDFYKNNAVFVFDIIAMMVVLFVLPVITSILIVISNLIIKRVNYIHNKLS